jgi:hypothetical protein
MCGTPSNHKTPDLCRWPAALLLLLGLTSGCAAWQSQADRQAAADRIARDGGFEKVSIEAAPFTLAAYLRVTTPGAPLHLYIEGDGAAWIDRAWRSEDPTPKRPLVMELAALDPAPNVAYLARPGQYPAAGSSPCDPAYWSDRRFSAEVVTAMGKAVDTLAAKGKAREIHFIGYSGGAAIAVLLAAGRTDVASLRTVAGNLDPEALNRHHRVSPLHRDSLNPLDAAPGLCRLPQRHFVGAEDGVVPPLAARSFVARAGFRDERAITVVTGASHSEGWRGQWKRLLMISGASCDEKGPCLREADCVDSMKIIRD